MAQGPQDAPVDETPAPDPQPDDAPAPDTTQDAPDATDEPARARLDWTPKHVDPVAPEFPEPPGPGQPRRINRTLVWVAAVAGVLALAIGAAGLIAGHGAQTQSGESALDLWTASSAALEVQTSQTKSAVTDARALLSDTDHDSGVDAERSDLSAAVETAQGVLDDVSAAKLDPNTASDQDLGAATDMADGLARRLADARSGIDSAASALSARSKERASSVAEAADALSAKITDASKLLKSSEGKVADDSTRTALKTVLDKTTAVVDDARSSTNPDLAKARIAGASASLAKSVAAVKDSMEAKEHPSASPSPTHPAARPTHSARTSATPKAPAPTSTAHPAPTVIARSTTSAEVSAAFSIAGLTLGDCSGAAGTMSATFSSPAAGVAWADQIAPTLGADRVFDIHPTTTLASGQRVVTIDGCTAR